MSKVNEHDLAMKWAEELPFSPRDIFYLLIKLKSEIQMQLAAGNGIETISMHEMLKIKPTVLQKDARLLRERLASIHKRAPQNIKDQIVKTLLQYAENVKLYCKCTDKGFVKAKKVFTCLDCGKEFGVEIA